MANYNKRSGGLSVGAKLAIVLFIILAIAAGLFGAGIGIGYIQFNNNNQQSAATEIGEIYVTNLEAKSMSLAVTQLDAIAETSTAVKLTATVLPDNATNTNIEWEMYWLNSSDSWASGKDVSDYVTLSDTTGKTITVTNTKAFGEEIIIKATASGGDNIYATCQIDFVAAISEVTLTVYNDDGNDLSIYDLTCPIDWNDDETEGGYVFSQYQFDMAFSTGTVTENYTLTNIRIYGEQASVDGSTSVYPAIAANIDNYESGERITTAFLKWYDIGDLWGLSPVVNVEHRNYLYVNHPTAVFSVTITGNTSGNTITKTFTMGFEFDNMYTAVSDISLNEDHIFFY